MNWYYALVIIALIGLLLLLGNMQVHAIEEHFTQERCRNLSLPFKIVVSSTTIPPRVQYLQDTIDNMYNQWYRPDKYILNIPRYSLRKKVPYPEEELKKLDLKNGWVQINRCDDIGPATKILGGFREVDDPETLIISIDDDQLYIPNFTAILGSYSKKHPNSIVTFNPKQGYALTNNILQTPVLMEGYVGIGYKRRHLTEEWYNFVVDLLPDTACMKSDDLLLSFLRNRDGINCVMIHTNFQCRETNSKIHIQSALGDDQRASDYKHCYQKLLQMSHSTIPPVVITSEDYITRRGHTIIQAPAGDMERILYHMGGFYLNTKKYVLREDPSHITSLYPRARVIYFAPDAFLVEPYYENIKQLMIETPIPSEDVKVMREYTRNYFLSS